MTCKAQGQRTQVRDARRRVDDVFPRVPWARVSGAGRCIEVDLLPTPLLQYPKGHNSRLFRLTRSIVSPSSPWSSPAFRGSVRHAPTLLITRASGAHH
ncbi:hypothetical protein PDE_09736 [Penicillium oxalicum 114-2]|uniref:Uncharacterized protein n=1 Tax=Penicillium oxalicum (strain 114-2 / CGMCC 5302) TaxID=933388 RepID=S8BHS6_PENO1|nr:hypothetical protein PDE_09736 [Penicillium oxalicum 114-2]